MMAFPPKVVWLRIQLFLAVHDWVWAARPDEGEESLGIVHYLTTGDRK